MTEPVDLDKREEHTRYAILGAVTPGLLQEAESHLETQALLREGIEIVFESRDAHEQLGQTKLSDRANDWLRKMIWKRQ